MKTIANFFKNIIAAFFGFLGTFSFASCQEMEPIMCLYGMPENLKSVSGKIYGDVNGDGTIEEIPGIKCTIKETKGYVVSDENGQYGMSFFSGNANVTLEVEDIDGEENGLFESQEVPLDFSNENNIGIDITLVNKQ